MKLNEQYLKTELGDSAVLVPIDEAAMKFRGIIRLNSTAKDIWEGISAGLTEEQIAEKLVEDYDGVTLEKAKQEVKELFEKLREADVLRD